MAFELNVSVEELRRTRKLFIATPMYGGNCAGMYTRSMMELTNQLTRRKIDHQPYFLFNESLITRARNYCADVFMRSDCTHMLFIDSDIGFSAEDVIALLAMQDDDSPYDIIGAPYPKKCISWEKIVMAVEKGFAEDDPEALNKFVGDYVFNPAHGTNKIPINEPVEVLEIGTGFMMIRKKTFESLAEKYPEYLYKPDHVRTADFDGTREIMMYFQAEIDPKSQRYLSEDYWFCQKVLEAGLKTWLCPWMKTQHVGTYNFAGSLADLASLGASATADPGLLKRNREKKETSARRPRSRKTVERTKKTTDKPLKKTRKPRAPRVKKKTEETVE